MGTPQFAALMAIEDPWSYRDRLTLPKYLINSAGDQFFLPDSAQFYREGLKGETLFRYVPNSDHSLDETDAFDSLGAFYTSVVNRHAAPEGHVDRRRHRRVARNDLGGAQVGEALVGDQPRTRATSASRRSASNGRRRR